MFSCFWYPTNETSYGMILAKDKNEEEAMRWLVRSVELFPMNWGCWLEMTSLISRVEDVSGFPCIHDRLLTCLAVESNITTPTSKYPFLHIPSSYFSRIISINSTTIQFSGTTSFYIPNQSFSTYLLGSFILSYQRFCHCRRSLQPSTCTTSSSVRLP